MKFVSRQAVDGANRVSSAAVDTSARRKSVFLLYFDGTGSVGGDSFEKSVAVV